MIHYCIINEQRELVNSAGQGEEGIFWLWHPFSAFRVYEKSVKENYTNPLGIDILVCGTC